MLEKYKRDGDVECPVDRRVNKVAWRYPKNIPSLLRRNTLAILFLVDLLFNLYHMRYQEYI
jgi:hypothetical protein